MIMDESSIIKAYKRQAGIYDYLFGSIFEAGRKAIVTSMNCQLGEAVLEVGAGTGLSLPLYPRGTTVVAIDISPHMLNKAKKRVEAKKLRNVHLEMMDAQDLQFDDNTFDKVVAMYVVPVVPDPKLLVAEMERVCKPGGDIFIVNHFSHSHPFIRRCEKFIAPLSRFIGFRPDLSMEEFIENTSLKVEKVTPTNLFGYWSIIHTKKEKIENLPLTNEQNNEDKTFDDQALVTSIIQ